jgi:hypothetical protein
MLFDTSYITGSNIEISFYIRKIFDLSKSEEISSLISVSSSTSGSFVFSSSLTSSVSVFVSFSSYFLPVLCFLPAAW